MKKTLRALFFLLSNCIVSAAVLAVAADAEEGSDNGAVASPSPAVQTSDSAAKAEQFDFFEKKIRPVLVTECYQCHSAESEKIQGGLVLDTRAGIRQGGELGPAVIPGNSTDSILLVAIRHQDDGLKMPPEKKLDADVIAEFETWVKMGAPDPRDGAPKIVRQEIDIEKGKQYWAFQAPKRYAPPAVENMAWPRSDIDRFVLASMEAKGLKPVEDADARTLIRRLSFDLIGLPPTPEEVESFVARWNENDQAALEESVDRLLDSPQFGERWGRHWLDVARYAESAGNAINYPTPHAWRYRDYVIASMNADKPYDRFLKEQLAGDLMPATDELQRTELTIATGYLAIGSKVLNNRDPLAYELDLADEQIDAFTQGILGLTVACARCHDHKFDPIPTKDYYSMVGIFRSTDTLYGGYKRPGNLRPSELIPLPTTSQVPNAMPKRPSSDITKAKQKIKSLKIEIEQEVEKTSNRLRYAMNGYINFLKLYDHEGNPLPFAMGVKDKPKSKDSEVFIRGEPDKPGPIAPRGFLQVMCDGEHAIGDQSGSGRMELAEWIASPKNPLTARVMVNRIWLHLLGRGIVPSPDNFGAAGLEPSHPELLDTLALSFVENGWSIKQQIRQIVLSRTYQLSSSYDADNFAVDPDNALVWRLNKRLLDAESMRDTLLAISGQLDLSPPIGSEIGIHGDEPPVEVRDSTQVHYRSVYVSIYRDLLPEQLSLFDFADPSTVTGERSATVLPSQGLYLLNSPFVIEQCDLLAKRLLSKSTSDRERLNYLYMVCFSRPPSTRESRASERYLSEFLLGPEIASLDRNDAQNLAWSCLCQSLLASAEFRNLN